MRTTSPRTFATAARLDVEVSLRVGRGEVSPKFVLRDLSRNEALMVLEDDDYASAEIVAERTLTCPACGQPEPSGDFCYRPACLTYGSGACVPGPSIPRV